MDSTAQLDGKDGSDGEDEKEQEQEQEQAQAQEPGSSDSESGRGSETEEEEEAEGGTSAPELEPECATYTQKHLTAAITAKGARIKFSHFQKVHFGSWQDSLYIGRHIACYVAL